MEAVHLLGANDATNTLRKRNIGNNKSKYIYIYTVKTKAAKLQNLDRHQCRSMMMKTYHHFMRKDIPYITKRIIRHARHSRKCKIWDYPLVPKLYPMRHLFFFSVSRILETAFSMIGVYISVLH